MRVVLASLLVLSASSVACANAPQREETAAPLIVPPLSTSSPERASSAPSRAAAPPPSPFAIPSRDPRPSMQSPRSPSELHAAIASLENDTTASGLHTLAETYAELARVEPRGGAREKAIETFDEIVSKHPTYAQLDEVLYDRALEHEIAGDKAKARRSYYELIQRKPNSQYVPYAYFAFAEIFFEEGASDPSKNQLAEQAYREVLKYSQSPMHAEAQSRLDELKKR